MPPETYADEDDEDAQPSHPDAHLSAGLSGPAGSAPAAAPAQRPRAPAPDGAPAALAEPFAALSPDAILNAIDAVLGEGPAAGLRTSGQVLALNSYENRVFQVGLESAAGALPDAAPVAPGAAPAALVVKFYRPGRWTDAQIQ